LKLSNQTQPVGDLRPESVDKIFEMIGSETKREVKTLQVIVEKRIAHIMTLEVALEKRVAEKYSVLEKSLTEMSKRFEQTEYGCKKIEDELRQELLLARREFNEHRKINERVDALAATSEKTESCCKRFEDDLRRELLLARQEFDEHRKINERVEALAATALTATQRELQTHQTALDSLADSVKCLEGKCESLGHRELLVSSSSANTELASLRKELSSHIESEIQRLQQGQQDLLDGLVSTAYHLQEQVAGVVSQCLSRGSQEEFGEALEKSQEQLASLQQMLEKSLSRLQEQPEISFAPPAVPELPQVCSLEASLADIRGRLFAQQCAQEDLQREICSLRGASVQQNSEQSSPIPSTSARVQQSSEQRASPPLSTTAVSMFTVSQAIRVGSRVEVRWQDSWYKGTVLKLPHDDAENQGRYCVKCDADGGGQTIRSKSVRLLDQDSTLPPVELPPYHLEDMVDRMAAQLSRLERRLP
jgi:polyhydroxyalkanoate synthesis regulator phasin